MYRRKFDNLNRKLAFRKENALEAVKIAQMEFYVELTKELHKSNKLDCCAYILQNDSILICFSYT